jgi:hypothetical protein
MRFFVAMFAATSSAEMSSLTSEPVSMLLWGVTLLTLGSMLRRPAGEPSAARVESSDSQSIGSVPSLAARS